MKEPFALVPEPSSEEASTFGVVILYEDFAAGVRAKHVADLLAREIGQPEASQLPALWKVSMLDDHLVNTVAAKQASTADIVIISLRDGHGLALPVRAWISRWITRQSGVARALVALFEHSGAATDFARRHLEGIARRAGMDFLTQTGAETEPNQVSPLTISWIS